MTDPFITLINKVLEVFKASLRLQSGHKSRYLDFIFELFIECIKFIFYFDFYISSLINMNASKETWLKKRTPVFSFLVIHFLKWMMEITMIDKWYDKTLINKSPQHLDTNRVLCSSNHVTGFYLRRKLGAIQNYNYVTKKTQWSSSWNKSLIRSSWTCLIFKDPQAYVTC